MPIASRIESRFFVIDLDIISYDLRSISRIVKEHLKEAGYNNDRLTAHSLRHSAVTLALLQGQDLAEVQAFARHRDISTTMIYNHAVDQEKNACSQAVADSIFA